MKNLARSDGSLPHLEVRLGAMEQRSQRLATVRLRLHVRQQVGDQPVVRDPVRVQVVLAGSGLLAVEGDVTAIRGEGIWERMLLRVRRRTGKRVEAAGVAAEADAEVAVRRLERPEAQDRARELARPVQARGRIAAERVQPA